MDLLSLGSVNAAATGWVLTATVLVAVLVPGIALFYGGMVQRKNVLAMVMQPLAAIGVVGLAWVLIGFSLAFDEGIGIIGGVRLVGLHNLGSDVPGQEESGVALAAFAAFHLMVAVFATALIAGAGAERWHFAGYALFVGLWSVLCYAPVAHWLFSPAGWASERGAYDYAGGLVVHANAGAAALAIALLLGRRREWPEEGYPPHNLPLSMVGAALLWCGWFGLTGGAALASDEVAAVAVLNTAVAAAAGLLLWIGLERLRFGKATTLGAVSGLVAGMVAITPAAGYVPPWSAAVIGLVAGGACHAAVGLKMWLRLDDSLDVAAVHLTGGVVGTICVGLFASRATNPRGPEGLVFGGGAGLLGEQAISTAAVVGYSFTLTLVLGWLVNRAVRNRVRPVEENIGLDVSQHGEAAYHLVSEETRETSVKPQPGPSTPELSHPSALAEHVGASAASAKR